MGTRNPRDLFASDMWSFGCIVLEILTGGTLYNGKSEVDQLLGVFRIAGAPGEEGLSYLKSLPSVSESGLVLPSSGQNWGLLEFNSKEDEPFFELVRSCLNPSPAERITARQALELEVFSDLL